MLRDVTDFLNIQTTRPLYGRAARDNLGPICVLEKYGFTMNKRGVIAADSPVPTTDPIRVWLFCV